MSRRGAKNVHFKASPSDRYVAALERENAILTARVIALERQIQFGEQTIDSTVAQKYYELVWRHSDEDKKLLEDLRQRPPRDITSYRDVAASAPPKVPQKIILKRVEKKE